MNLQFLDNSALNDLVESDQALVRHRLIDEVGAGRVVVLGTAPLLLEMNGTRAVDAAKHRALVQLFERISNGSKLLLDPPTRRMRELAAGGALKYPDFVETGFEPSRDPAAVDAAAAKHAQMVEQLREEETKKAEAAVIALDALEREAAEKAGTTFNPDKPEWRRKLKDANRNERYVLQLAEDFAREAMDRCGPLLGVPDTRKNQSAREFPTFFSSALIHVARIRAVILGGTKPGGKKSAGYVDLLHLEEAASYADVFVTSDGRLRSFATQVRNIRCEVVSYTDWAKRLTS